MPKRRMTAARARQVKAWQVAGQLASLRARHGSSHPSVTGLKQKIAYKSGKLGYTPPGMGGRRSKLGGKAYTHKTASNFKVSQEVTDLMAGKTTLAATSAKHEAAGIDHNGPGLKPSPRGGGHKIAPKPPKQAPKPSIPMHGSGTGLTSAYRYLPVNVAARKRQVKGKKVKHHGTF
jgi:hypothetical protein